MVDRATAVINAQFPTADAGIVDCPICVEDHGLVIDVRNSLADQIVADATVYGALPRGTYLVALNEFTVKLVRA